MIISTVNTKEFNLPEEVWVHVWSFLNFKNCQQICTLVCKTWFDQIRNSSALSGELKIFRSDTETQRYQEFSKFMKDGKIEKNFVLETKKFELEDDAEAVLHGQGAHTNEPVAQELLGVDETHAALGRVSQRLVMLPLLRRVRTGC